jgi:hypothetical protein
MADQPEHVKRQLAEDKENRERSFAVYQERMKGKPTPTQEENDRAKLGEHVLEKEDDGGGPDINELENEAARHGRSKQMKPASTTSGGYQTRSVPPKPAGT